MKKILELMHIQGHARISLIIKNWFLALPEPPVGILPEPSLGILPHICLGECWHRVSAFEISCIENSIMVTLNQHTKFKDLAALLDWVSVCVCRTCILLVSVCVKTNNSTQSFSLKLVAAGFLSLYLSLYFVTHANFFLPSFFSILTR